jgi:hypothetical protein
MARRDRVVGLISDTHGLLREAALKALAGSDLIIHAGDIGKLEILDALRALAPVVAVRGNIETEPWTSALPTTAVAQAQSGSMSSMTSRSLTSILPPLGSAWWSAGIPTSRRAPSGAACLR